jgi:hypothetical protein
VPIQWRAKWKDHRTQDKRWLLAEKIQTISFTHGIWYSLDDCWRGEKEEEKAISLSIAIKSLECVRKYSCIARSLNHDSGVKKKRKSGRANI